MFNLPLKIQSKMRKVIIMFALAMGIANCQRAGERNR